MVLSDPHGHDEPAKFAFEPRNNRAGEALFRGSTGSTEMGNVWYCSQFFIPPENKNRVPFGYLIIMGYFISIWGGRKIVSIVICFSASIEPTHIHQRESIKPALTFILVPRPDLYSQGHRVWPFSGTSPDLRISRKTSPLDWLYASCYMNYIILVVITYFILFLWLSATICFIHSAVA